MKDIVFVSGHKNPDSDSICSAIAYADFLFKIGRYNAVPVRLGEINKEISFRNPCLIKNCETKSRRFRL